MTLFRRSGVTYAPLLPTPTTGSTGLAQKSEPVAGLFKEAILHEFDAARREIEWQLGRWERTHAFIIAALALIAGAQVLRTDPGVIQTALKDNYWWYMVAAIIMLTAPAVAIDANMHINLLARYAEEVLRPKYQLLLRLTASSNEDRWLLESDERRFVSSQQAGVFGWEAFRDNFLWHERKALMGRHRAFWLQGSWFFKDSISWLPSVILFVLYGSSLARNYPVSVGAWLFQVLWMLLGLVAAAGTIIAFIVASYKPAA